MQAPRNPRSLSALFCAAWLIGYGAAFELPAASQAFQLEGQDHWAFQPRRVTSPPSTTASEWSHSAIDRFISASHQENNLRPAGLANRRTLARRATFDLIGLPPRPEEIEAFLRDPSNEETAFARLIDRLLASPHYGERWGRNWLDVARYADTQGDVGDFPIPAAYLYRNWVIDALNRDMPFQEFVQRQIAGDILAENEASPEAARESIIATGFIALSQRFGNTKADDMHLTIEDTLDTIGRGVLGLTLRCARCHDHKFDPLLASDYYGLYGLFESVRYPWMGMSNSKSPSDLSPGIPGKEHQEKAAESFALITRYEYQMNNHFRPWLKPTLTAYSDVVLRMDKAEKAGTDLTALKQEREKYLKYRSGKFRELMLHGLNWIKKENRRIGEKPDYDYVFGVSEDKPKDTRIHVRGNPADHGEIALRRAPMVFGGEAFANPTTSGRLKFAQWLTRDDHPLTARVVVNRVWGRHFSRGLVTTTDNFGHQGELPTHPELLDWLAEDFVAKSWSLKRLHRQIMLSRAYRLASERNESNLAADPENKFLWHFSRQRLDAESIRDAMLFVADRLDTRPGGKHPFKPWYAKKYSLNAPFHEEYPSLKRSVYLMTQRLFKHPFLGLFDGADTSSSQGTRNTSNNPGQALYLLNSDFVRTQSLVFADRALEQAGVPSDALQWIWNRAYGRPASADEIHLALGHIKTYKASATNHDHLEREAWASLTRAVLTSNEFFYVE